MIYLKHPIHGEKFALVESEAVMDEQNGWVRSEFVMRPKKVIIATDGQAPEPTAPAASVTAPARRGRPPKA